MADIWKSTTIKSDKMLSMFDEAHKAVSTRLSTGTTVDGSTTLAISEEEALPSNYSLWQLNEEFIRLPISSQDKKLARVAIIKHCLQSRERLILEDRDYLARQELYVWLSDLINPDAALFIGRDTNYGTPPAEKEKSIVQWKSISVLALKSIELLESYDFIPGEVIGPATLLSLLSFTKPSDVWNSKAAYEIAAGILDRHKQKVSSEEFITEYVLKDFIRPLFMKSRPDTVTSQGRKATNTNVVNQRQRGSNDFDPATKPWKFCDIQAATVFGWTIANALEDVISRSWHLFIPPLLTLLDDSATPVRASGLVLLSELLQKIPQRMLEQTGLGDVFEEAVLPTLSFLPSLTPVDESLLLLKEAYKALFILGDLRFDIKKVQSSRNRLLDRILRQGVFHGLDHCGGNASITELLLKEMSDIVDRMGIYSIKHLKDIIPVLSTILMDPFAPSNPGLLLQGIKATQTTILNCWPVMSEEQHRLELIKALSVCWVTVAEEVRNNDVEQKPELSALTREMKIAALLLLKSVEGTVDLGTEITSLISLHPGISDLFEPGFIETTTI